MITNKIVLYSGVVPEYTKDWVMSDPERRVRFSVPEIKDMITSPICCHYSIISQMLKYFLYDVMWKGYDIIIEDPESRMSKTIENLVKSYNSPKPGIITDDALHFKYTVENVQ